MDISAFDPELVVMNALFVLIEWYLSRNTFFEEQNNVYLYLNYDISQEISFLEKHGFSHYT